MYSLNPLPKASPWVSARRSRSRSPYANVAATVADLEKRVVALEQKVNELQTEKAWWTWWYENWGKWLQTNVLRLSDIMGTISNAWVRGRTGQERQHERPQQRPRDAAQPTMDVTSDGSLGMP